MGETGETVVVVPTLVVRDGRTGREYRSACDHPANEGRMRWAGYLTGLDRLTLRLRLLMTLAGGPPVEACGLSWRLENAN